MKDIIISGIVGLVVGVLVILGYGYFNQDNTIDTKLGDQERKIEIGDEQIQKMSERSGISEEEITKRLDSGETMRDIMGEMGGGTRGMSGDRDKQ